MSNAAARRRLAQLVLAAQGADQLRVQQELGRLAARGRRHVELLVQSVQEAKIAERGLPRAGVAQIVQHGRDPGVGDVAHAQPHLSRPLGLLEAKLRHDRFQHVVLEREDA